MIGKTLSHYNIVEKIGMGGMGEVFRAKDQKLGREVAIKVLPEEFARDADRVARFQREAKLLASLNHPNIGSIYGLEEAEGTNFLVLELIEGDTLADRLKRGAIPVEEALKLALQIAEALEAAHEKGVIHRDLKPANIKVTPDGKVKVLDFGLAKAYAGEQEEVNLSNSPTLSDAATQQGVILGTAAYMSPEQARGKQVDKRADVWAFGCVLFEMLTGKAAFSGRDVTDILAAVIRAEPEWKSLPANLHWRLKEVLERCLEKEAKDRYGSINDARVDIQRVLADPGGVFVQAGAEVKPKRKLRLGLSWISAIAIVCIIVAGAVVWYLKPMPAPEPRQVVRFELELPEGQQFNRDPGGGNNIAVSADGSQLVYGTVKGLYLRSIDKLEPTLIAGTDKNSYAPFFSPDGQWIGYVSGSDQKLKKVSVNGGAPIALCDASTAVIAATWDSGSTIFYTDLLSGAMRVSANGGTPEIFIKGNLQNLKEKGFSIVSQVLPDGKTLLLTQAFDTNTANMQIAVQSIESGERSVLHKGGVALKYLPTGYIIYGLTSNNSRNLFALPFDLDTLKVTGGAVPILEGIGAIALSNSGTLVYIPQPGIAAESGTQTPFGRTLVWVNREGKEEPLPIPRDQYGFFKISPDGMRVALGIGPENAQDIWIYDVTYETLTPLTFNPGDDEIPLWTPDGKRVIYFSTSEGALLGGIHWKNADGTGKVERIGSEPDGIVVPFSRTKDGKTLALWEYNLAPIQQDIAMLSMEGDAAKVPLLHEQYNEFYPQISPNGQFIAYQSDESGKYEIYVRPFPDVDNGGRWQVSTSGGDSPLWSPDGRELFYRNGDSFMAVDVETDPSFKRGKPKILFTGRYFSVPAPIECTVWDVHPDGKRFLMLKPREATAEESSSKESTALGPRKINIVLNWFEELKERVPVD